MKIIFNSNCNKNIIKRHVGFTAKLACILLSACIIASVAQFSTFPLAAADRDHSSKAKKDGSGVGEGSSIHKGSTQSWALTKHNQKHHSDIKNMKEKNRERSSDDNNKSCNCVIFRLDDVQDYWLSGIQTTVMDQFIAKNKPLAVGPILDYIGSDSNVVSKVNSGYQSGLFEIFVHGWDHVDYSQLSLQNQTSTLQLAKNKTISLFGVTPKIFVPPYDSFNADTLSSMNKTGLNIISAADWADSYPNFIADGKRKITDSFGIYHMPSSIGFVDFMPDGSSVRVSNDQILADVDSSISLRGYAVVTLHAQDFRQKVNGAPVDVLNQTEISDLNSLMDSLASKHISITTFGKTTEFRNHF